MDEQTFVPDATGEATPLTGENGTQAQPEAAQVQTPPAADYLSRADFEKWQAETDARWQARLNDVVRQSQAKADKARDTAIRKANAFEQEYVDALKASGVELEPDQVATIKKNIIEREFWNPAATAANEPTSPNPNPASMPAPSGVVTRDELVQYLQTQGLDASAVDLSKYENQPRGSAELDAMLLEDVTVAKAAQIQKRKAQKQQQAQAAQVSQVKEQFGTLAVGVGGQAAAGYDPVEELNKMNRADPPSDPREMQAWLARREKIKAEVKASGRW